MQVLWYRWMYLTVAGGKEGGAMAGEFEGTNFIALFALLVSLGRISRLR